jgi:hypothetical protein
MPGDRSGHCDRCGDGAAQSARSHRTDDEEGVKQAENRGIAWVVGAFLLCPCHLPLTLGLAATLLAGTGVGAALRGHLVLAGAVIALAWLAATWHGLYLLHSARTLAGTLPSDQGSSAHGNING